MSSRRTGRAETENHAVLTPRFTMKKWRWRAVVVMCGAAVCLGADSAPKKRKQLPPGEQPPMSARPGGAPASFEVRTFTAPNGAAIRYSLFIPKAISPGEKLPLVLCLHGSGGNTEAARVLASPERQAKTPCIVMAPGCDSRKARWVPMTFRPDERGNVMAELLGALDALTREQPVDPGRVYVTGQSMGGVGTWGLIAAEPQRFAAAAPVCGIWQTEDAAKMARVPVWAFHGEKDPTVPVDGSRRMVAALKAAGASPRYTEYPDVGHNSWTAAYATDELWEWMFAQRRKAP
jgi:predicted peptidase